VPKTTTPRTTTDGKATAQAEPRYTSVSHYVNIFDDNTEANRDEGVVTKEDKTDKKFSNPESDTLETNGSNTTQAVFSHIINLAGVD